MAFGPEDFWNDFFGDGDGAVAAATGTYCSRDDVEDIYGIANVARWADLENNEDEDEIGARELKARQKAYTELNSLMRNKRYVTPFTAPLPDEIVELAATYAGLWLYESRGAVDQDEQGNRVHRYALKRKEFYRKVKAIVVGGRDLEGQTLLSPRTAPQVV